MLTDQQIALIRSSAQHLADSDVSATNVFYTNLFRKAPGVRPLFPEDMFSQSEKLWSSIVAVVNNIDDLNALRPTLLDMGARHVAYGAKEAHYAVVCETLVETIGAFLGDDWTPAHDVAWQTATAFVADTMIEGSHVAA